MMSKAFRGGDGGDDELLRGGPPAAWQGPNEKNPHTQSPKPKHLASRQSLAAVNCVAWDTLNPRLRVSLRVHDGAETPSTISLKQASTIAAMHIYA